MKFSKKFSYGALALAFAASAGYAGTRLMQDDATPGQACSGVVAGMAESFPPQYVIRLDSAIAGRSTLNVAEDFFTEAQRQELTRGKAVAGQCNVVDNGEQKQVTALSLKIVNRP